MLQWVKDRFGSRIETLARQAAGAPMAVEFAVADARAPAAKASTPARRCCDSRRARRRAPAGAR